MGLILVLILTRSAPSLIWQVMNAVLAEWWAVVYKTVDEHTRIFTGPYVIETNVTAPNVFSTLELTPNPYAHLIVQHGTSSPAPHAHAHTPMP